VIALNKESLILDPIDWPVLKNELLEWAQRYCPELTINDETDNLFRERALPAHRARVGPSHPPKPVGPYRFFCQSNMKKEEKHFIDCGIPAELARKIDRTNRHEQGLSLLGILPNQLRAMLRNSTESIAEAEKAWTDVSKTLFWQGYSIWSMRRKLNAAFWKNIAPADWKKYKSDPSKSGKVKQSGYPSRRKRKQKSSPSCANPFHFLDNAEIIAKKSQLTVPVLNLNGQINAVLCKTYGLLYL